MKYGVAKIMVQFFRSAHGEGYRSFSNLSIKDNKTGQVVKVELIDAPGLWGRIENLGLRLLHASTESRQRQVCEAFS